MIKVRISVISILLLILILLIELYENAPIRMENAGIEVKKCLG